MSSIVAAEPENDLRVGREMAQSFTLIEHCWGSQQALSFGS